MKTVEWQPYFDAVEEGMTLEERLEVLVPMARRRFDEERFRTFCDEHLAHLDEVTWEWFGTEAARDAVRRKVSAVFPPHEVDEFTELFWSRIQRWRDQDEARASS